MPFNRPSLATLVDRAEADIATRLPGADARLRRSVLNVLARLVAGAVHGLYGFLDWIARQVIYDTAEGLILERWAAIWGLARKPATSAAGDATLTGADGSVVPIGTLLQRADGIRYETEAEAIIAAGTATVAVVALDAAVAGDADSGVQLAFVSPVAGVNSTATVAAGGLAGGADAETDALLRDRLLDRIQAPPHGGAAADYVAWALEVPGVTRAWVYGQELGPGTVSVRFMMDATYDDGIPEVADVAAVQAWIDDRRPVTADVTVVAPVPVALDLELEITPDTTAVRAAVEAEVADLIRREAEPGGTVLLSHIREAISVAAGETDHVLADPVANVTHATGEIAVPGTVTWV